jgi:hypothetical protein
MAYRLNQGLFDLPFPLPPPRSDRDDSEGGSSDGTSGGGWSAKSSALRRLSILKSVTHMARS